VAFLFCPYASAKEFHYSDENWSWTAYLEHFDNITCTKHFVHDHKFVRLICREIWGQDAVAAALSVKQPACRTWQFRLPTDPRICVHTQLSSS
jgi:hypothetical protein